MSNTEQQYNAAITICRNLFQKKAMDYGTSWRVLRTISVIDQIFIKALRIRNLQELVVQMVDDDVQSEFTGIINYAVIGLIQLQLNVPLVEDIEVAKALGWYNDAVKEAYKTMTKKNNDYGEAWREMSQQSFTDLILVKLLRVKQILLNDGKTLVSEGIDANYIDIINYAVFALILIAEGKHKG